MLRSMTSAVTGLRAQQTAMDVIGNNIANVNTAGFKSSRTTFKDIYYQTVGQGSQSTNPEQIGYGSEVASVDKIMSSTGATQTDRSLDVYIDGSGYFMVNTKANGTGDNYYTRVGNFSINPQGYLVDSNGNYVMGENSTYSPPTISAPINLQSQNGTVTFQTASGGTVPISSANYSNLSNITINNDGTMTASISGLTGAYASLNGQTGTFYVNGGKLQLALAAFVNPDGLTQVGNNDYLASQSSGAMNLLAAGTGTSTVFRPGALEMSNVDLAGEFTSMIQAERGYQATARVITTSDNMMQELVNLIK